MDVLYCILNDSPEALNMMQEEHIKVIISLLEKFGRDPKVLDILCKLCVGSGAAVRSSQNNIADFLLPGKNLLLHTAVVDHVARYIEYYFCNFGSDCIYRISRCTPINIFAMFFQCSSKLVCWPRSKFRIVFEVVFWSCDWSRWANVEHDTSFQSWMGKHQRVSILNAKNPNCKIF